MLNDDRLPALQALAGFRRWLTDRSGRRRIDTVEWPDRGIRGIIGGLFRPNKGDLTWRLAFIGGLILAPVVFGIFYASPEIQIDASWTILAIAGLLVGVCTRYASGCTSGHGVCGISRLSPQSRRR